MSNIFLVLIFLGSVITQDSLLPMNRCLGNCAVCKNDELSTCSGKELVECVKGYNGQNCPQKETIGTELVLIDSVKPDFSSKVWRNSSITECTYTDSKKQQTKVSVLGLYRTFGQNGVTLQIQPYYSHFILSFNLIRGSWTPFSDLLKISILDQADVQLSEYYIEFPRRDEINPDINLLRCKNQALLIEKYQIEGILKPETQKSISILFEGMIFSEAQWGITNMKILFGCSKFLVFDGTDCLKCGQGFYLVRNVNKTVQSCQPCPLNCNKCTDGQNCQSCIEGFTLNAGKCSNTFNSTTLPVPGRSLVCSNFTLLVSSLSGVQQKIEFTLKALPSHNKTRLIFYLAFAPSQFSTKDKISVAVDGKQQMVLSGEQLKNYISKPKQVCKQFGKDGYFTIMKVITPYFEHQNQNLSVSIVGNANAKMGVSDANFEYQPYVQPPKPEPPKTEPPETEPPKNLPNNATASPTNSSDSTPKTVPPTLPTNPSSSLSPPASPPTVPSTLPPAPTPTPMPSPPQSPTPIPVPSATPNSTTSTVPPVAPTQTPKNSNQSAKSPANPSPQPNNSNYSPTLPNNNNASVPPKQNNSNIVDKDKLTPNQTTPSKSSNDTPPTNHTNSSAQDSPKPDQKSDQNSSQPAGNNTNKPASETQASKMIQAIQKIEKVKDQIQIGLKRGKQLVATLLYPIQLETIPYISARFNKKNTTMLPEVSLKTNQYQQLTFHLDQSLLDETIQLYMSDQNPIQVARRGLQAQSNFNLGSIKVSRFDHLSESEWDSINRYSVFFEVLAWFTIVSTIVLSFLGNSVITQKMSLLLQIIFLHVYIYSQYLPVNFKQTISGLRRMENLDYFSKGSATEMQRFLLGNVIQFSPPKFTMFNTDINFTRAVYPSVILILAYLVWFGLINLIRKRIQTNLVVSGVEEQRTRGERIKLFIIRTAERIMNFWYQVWQYMYIVFVWAGCVQMHNLTYPTGSDRSQIPNIIFCFICLILCAVLPIVTLLYLNKKYFRFDYFEYSYWYQNIFFQKLPEQSLPSNHHRILIVVRNLRHVILVVCFAFLGDYPVQALVIIIAAHFVSLLYNKITHIQIKPFNSKLNIIEYSLLIALAICMIVAYGTSKIFNTHQYLVIGHVLTTICLLLSLVGLVRVFYNLICKLNDQITAKQLSEFKPAIGTERIV